MAKNHQTEDILDRLFAAARESGVPDEGFARRVVERLEPLPPSKNSYRIPTLATAFASVSLVVWVAVSGFDFSSVAQRWREFDGEVADIRLVPTMWHIPSILAATGERSAVGDSPAGRSLWR